MVSAADQPIPLPSHIHYELLLQLLERQSLTTAYQNPDLREPLQKLIATLRKALAQQRQLEDLCKQQTISVEYHWSLNQSPLPRDAG